MDPNTPRAEAERWLGISEKLLASRDLVGSRSFAIRAREADPTNPISEQILAVVDTLMAAEKRVINSGHHDWYSILQLSHLVRDPDLIASHYRRLVLLLNPEHNHLPYADFAIRVVFDAWSVLSDPTKKWMYDSELSIFLQRTSAPPDPEHVRVDSSSSATYQFFQQPPPPLQQAPAWIHHPHQHEQPQERQLFQQQHHLQPQPPPPPPQSQWLPQTQSQLQQLLPEQQRPSPSQWLPQPPQQQRIPQAPLPQRPPQWLPEQQRPPPQQQPPKEPQVPPQLQRQQPQQQKQPKKKTPPPPPPAPAPAQTTPPHRPLQPPPQPPPQQPPQPPPQKPPQPSPPPQQPQKENIVGSKEDGIGRASNVTNEKATDNGNKKNECDDSANVIDNDNNHDGGEHIERFWTACPYCYYLYEYSKTFQDYTLRCQNCRRAFQAVQIPNPPETGDESSFCSWGFFPIGFSMTSWKKSMPNANGFGSNWMPFSPMFACPMQDVKKEVWTIVDASDDDDDDLDVSSDDSDSSGDWGSNRKKVKRANGRSKRGRPGRKSNAEREKMANQHSIDGENSQIPRTDVVNNNKVVASGSLRKQTGKGVRGRKKLDLNVEFSNEVEDHAPVARDGNGEEVGFFEGLDEFLSTLPILHVVGDDKAKPS